MLVPRRVQQSVCIPCLSFVFVLRSTRSIQFRFYGSCYVVVPFRAVAGRLSKKAIRIQRCTYIQGVTVFVCGVRYEWKTFLFSIQTADVSRYSWVRPFFLSFLIFRTKDLFLLKRFPYPSWILTFQFYRAQIATQYGKFS